MSTPSQQNASAQSKMTIPSLQDIIVHKNASYTIIDEYLRCKKNGIDVPKPVLSGPVVIALREKMKRSSDMEVSVSRTVACLWEFSSNPEVQGPWHEFCEEIVAMINDCLHFFITLKSMTTLVSARYTYFTKLCYLFTELTVKSQDLSTKLFITCAKNLFRMLFAKDMSENNKSAILSALSCMCQDSDESLIADTFEELSIYLKILAGMSFDVSTDDQMRIYTILITSLSGKKISVNGLAAYFYQWPPLQATFIASCAKPFYKGCGMFLDKIFELTTRYKNRDLSTPSNLQTCSSGYQMRSCTSRKTSGRSVLAASPDKLTPAKSPNVKEISSKDLVSPYFNQHNRSLLKKKEAEEIKPSFGVKSGQHLVQSREIKEERDFMKQGVSADQHRDSFVPKLKPFSIGEFEAFDSISKNKNREESSNTTPSHKYPRLNCKKVQFDSSYFSSEDVLIIADSQVDTTHSALKKYSSSSQCAVQPMREFLLSANKVCPERVSTSKAPTSEFDDMKEFAKRITTSAERCQSVTFNNQPRLREKIHPWDWSLRQGQASNKECVYNLVQKALSNNLSFSSSDSE